MTELVSKALVLRRLCRAASTCPWYREAWDMARISNNPRTRHIQARAWHGRKGLAWVHQRNCNLSYGRPSSVWNSRSWHQRITFLTPRATLQLLSLNLKDRLFQNGIHNNHHSTINSKLPSPSPAPAETSISEDTTIVRDNDYLQLDAVTVAFRVRYMLYEKSIGLIFPANHPSISPDIDYAIFDEPEESSKAQLVAPVVTRQADDDDYDDEDEDEDETKPADTNANNSAPSLGQENNEKSVILSRFWIITFFQILFTRY